MFRFEDFELDTDRYELQRSGVSIKLEPQVFDVLAFLVTNGHRTISKEELLDNVWGDRFVSESALTSRIKSARKAIDDDGHQQRLIRTHHGRGYEFVGEVLDVETTEPRRVALPDVRPAEACNHSAAVATGIWRPRCSRGSKHWASMCPQLSSTIFTRTSRASAIT